jgi:hypothetical protein
MDMKPNTHDWVQFGLFLDEQLGPALFWVAVFVCVSFL